MMLFLLLPAVVWGQQKEYTLNGSVQLKEGGAGKYKVVFTLSGSVIKGYSLTYWGDEAPLRASIKGTLNRKRQQLTFIETNLASNNPGDAQASCMFDVKLSYYLDEGRYFFKGPFTGRDNNKAYCGEGTVTFEEQYKAGGIFETQKPAEPQKQREEPIPKKELPESFNKITSGQEKTIDWVSDSCVVELWDGGFIDGDMVSVTFNDKKVLTDYTLRAEKQQLILPLTRNINTLVITAENEGTSPPNTVQVLLTGPGNAPYGLLACNVKGKSVTIILKKK